MISEEWNERYVKEFIRAANLSREEAQVCADAAENPMDGYEDDPEGAAREEMSYWTD